MLYQVSSRRFVRVWSRRRLMIAMLLFRYRTGSGKNKNRKERRSKWCNRAETGERATPCYNNGSEISFALSLCFLAFRAASIIEVQPGSVCCELFSPRIKRRGIS